jgi:hypothetical protein
VRNGLSKPVFWSLISGCVWIGVASAVAYAVSPIHTTPLKAASTFAGGMIAAPLIGVLIGHMAQRFARVTGAVRIGIALADLYFATYLFLLAANIARVGSILLARGHVENLALVLGVGPVFGTLMGLTYTGFVFVLFPLSYVNHVLIAKTWDHAGR